MKLQAVVCLLFWMGCTAFAVAQTNCTEQEVRTEIIIAAPIDSVWKVLVDVAHYPEWNPYIYAVEGKLEQGKMLRFKMKKGESGTRKFKARLLTLDKPRALAWGGEIPLLFTARHYFELSAVGAGETKFVQGERWGGAMGKGYGRGICQEACKNFQDMNLALQQRCVGH